MATRRITPAQIIKRAMSRLEKRGKGSILLLHDIHPATVEKGQRALVCGRLAELVLAQLSGAHDARLAAS